MVSHHLNSNIDSLSRLRLHLIGFFSGYDDTIYIADFETSAEKKPFLDYFRSFDLNGWKEYLVPRPFETDDPEYSFWKLEISFSNGTEPLRFASNESVPPHFHSLLDLMNVQWDYDEFE